MAMFMLGISSIEFTIDRPADATMLGIFWVSLGLAAFGLLVEARRDLYTFCIFATVFGVIAAIITGSVVVYGVDPHPVAGVVAVLTGAGSLACVIYLVRTQYGSEILPNVLRTEFADLPVHEVDGVQFVASQSAAELPVGGVLEIRVVVQNCWDRERTLVFRLKPERRITLNSAGLLFDRSACITLGPAEVGVLSIPIVAEANANGRYSLMAQPRVQGDGGARVRRRRAPELSSQIPAWMTALGALGGILVWGGGMPFKVVVRQSAHSEPGPVSALPVQTEILWQPDPQVLNPASRAV